MCYLDIYSKKSFDINEDTLMYIHPPKTYACFLSFFLFLHCLGFFLGEQIHIALLCCRSAFLRHYTFSLNDAFCQQKLQVARGRLSTTRLK